MAWAALPTHSAVKTPSDHWKENFTPIFFDRASSAWHSSAVHRVSALAEAATALRTVPP